LETSCFQKILSLLDDLTVERHKGVGDVQTNEIAHAFCFCSFNGYFAVIVSWNHEGEDWVDAAVACDHAKLELGGFQPHGKTFCTCPELISRRSVNPFEKVVSPEFVDHFASTVRRTEHHDPAKVGDRVTLQIRAQQNAAHRVGDEMDFGRGRKSGGELREQVSRKCVDVRAARWIIAVDDRIACGSQSRCKFRHGAVAAV